VIDMKKIEFFKVEGDKITRVCRHCPKCGPGVFLAEHKDRFSCGRCGYTEFKSSGKKEVKPPKVEEKPIVEQVEKTEGSAQGEIKPMAEKQQSEPVKNETVELDSKKEEKENSSDPEASKESKD